MIFTRVLLVLVLCVGSSSCLTCYQCHKHDIRMCSPVHCKSGEACFIHDDHRRSHSHVSYPNGCQKASECGSKKCCYNDACVEKVMGITHAPHLHTTQHVHTMQHLTTPQQVTQTAQSTRSPYVCQDEVHSVMTNCHDIASSGGCQGLLGVRVCQKTCGFCEYVSSTYGQQGYCRDLLKNDGCSHDNVCTDSFAVHLCPQTCRLCDLKLQNVMKDFLNKTLTTSTTATPCLDTIENNGCASLPNVCEDKLGLQVCPRFCNLCDTGVVQNLHTATNNPSTATTVTVSQQTNNHGTASQQCVDELKNDGCALLPSGICEKSIAVTVCPKFCNKCGQR